MTIDCSEVDIQRTRNLTVLAQTWPNYKHNNTAKYLIGITSSGAAMFLSEGWGGRVSDKQISVDSGFLDKISMGDCILADRVYLQRRVGVSLCYTEGSTFRKEVDTSRQLSNIRIHIEKVIGQVQKFRMLQNILPLTQTDLLRTFPNFFSYLQIMTITKFVFEKWHLYKSQVI